MNNSEIILLAEQLGQLLQSKQLILATAESCTGGLVAAAITEIAGSSAWFERGFVTYSNKAKEEMLGVPQEILEKYGAVSEQTALAMATGALQHSHTQISLAITGIAGPQGGTTDKPVGTVWFAWAKDTGEHLTSLQQFTGNREAIRQQAVWYVLNKLLQFIC